MRILAVHNRYMIAGGEDQSHLAEVALLREMGHQVDEYLEDNRRVNELGLVQTAIRTIWSQETYLKIKKVLQQDKYDLVLVQNFFPLISPSVFYAARRQKVPAILTVRNYRLFCLNGLALLKDEPCLRCLKKAIPWPGVYHACYRQDRLASSVVGLMLMLHRALGTWKSVVSHYIVLNQFSFDLFRQAGIPPEKIHIKPNFVLPDPGAGNGSASYVLYIGRLSHEKGVELLLSAWETGKVNLPLKIVGDGPLRARVERASAAMPRIQYLGGKSQTEIFTLLKDALALVFPSIWYEGMPRVILESFSVGTPVLASRIGSMKEIIKPGINGYFFAPNNLDDLRVQLESLYAAPQSYLGLRTTTRMDFEQNYSVHANVISWKTLFSLLKIPR